MEAPPFVKGDHLTLSLVSWGRLGEAMAQHQGRDVFVFGGIPGEQVVAEITRVHRKYIAATVVQVLAASPDRVEPPCPYYGECTGCQWQHISSDRQLAIKRQWVIDALSRVGGFSQPPVSPVLPAPQQYGYRNHARFTVGPGGNLGFVGRESRRFIRIDRCMLMHEGINQLLAQLQGKCGETTQLAVRAGPETGDFLVQPRLKSPEIPVATGQKYYVDAVAGRPFRVASPSFFQVNTEQTARLVQVVQRSLDLNGTETLLDAYAGVGAFAILLAPRVRRVIAVEESAAAVADARENASGLDNVEFVLGKTEQVLPSMAYQFDVVVLDPPRSGCQPQVLEHLVQLAPRRIAYVSCDAETLARDLKLLCDGHYRLDRVEALDMFSQTYHVECVAVLTRRAPVSRHSDLGQWQTSPIILASASPRRRELLSDLGLQFRVVPADIPEDSLADESAQELVQRLSLAKARAVAPEVQRGYIIGADSVVVLDGQIMSKPADAADARRMLQLLRGTIHQVTTGLTVIDTASGRHLTDSVTSQVTMRNFSDAELEAYVASGKPLDKAGAYAIQDRDFQPARSSEGCYTNIVGLPVCRLVEMLRDLGCRLPANVPASATHGCNPCRLAGP